MSPQRKHRGGFRTFPAALPAYVTGGGFAVLVSNSAIFLRVFSISFFVSVSAFLISFMVFFAFAVFFCKASFFFPRRTVDLFQLSLYSSCFPPVAAYSLAVNGNCLSSRPLTAILSSKRRPSFQDSVSVSYGEFCISQSIQKVDGSHKFSYLMFHRRKSKCSHPADIACKACRVSFGRRLRLRILMRYPQRAFHQIFSSTWW